MEAKELRIDSWYINDCDDSYIQLTKDNIVAAILDEDWLLPIPLTPEILEKAGFHKNRIGNLAIELNDMATHLELTQVDEKYFPAIDQLQDIGTPQNVALNYIEYLHQLQKLYFALTGEELKIEL